MLPSPYPTSFWTVSLLWSPAHQCLACNRTIDIETGSEKYASGRITSPNFPSSYDHNSTCVTRIKVPEDKQILLVFKQFLLEYGVMSGYGSSAYFSSWRDRLTIACSNDRLAVSLKICGFTVLFRSFTTTRIRKLTPLIVDTTNQQQNWVPKTQSHSTSRAMKSLPETATLLIITRQQSLKMKHPNGHSTALLRFTNEKVIWRQLTIRAMARTLFSDSLWSHRPECRALLS